jgi:pilus assembly protein Flp/PilA
MGASPGDGTISHARRRPAAYPHAARSSLRRFAADRGGATVIEYAIIASLVSILIYAGVSGIGNKLLTYFTNVATNLK